MTDPAVAPYGSWRRPIRIDDLVGDNVTLTEPWLDGDDVFWLEGRPDEGGRRVLVRVAADGTVSDLTAAPINVRTRVHEYGGGAYVVAGGVVAFSDFADGRVYRLDPGVRHTGPDHPGRTVALRRPPVSMPPGGGMSRSARTTAAAARPSTTIVDVALDGDREPRSSSRGRTSSRRPRLSPGRVAARLARMEPSRHALGRHRPAGRAGRRGRDPGRARPSPAGGRTSRSSSRDWSPDGDAPLRLRPQRLEEPIPARRRPRLEPLAPMEAEFGDPELGLRPLDVRVPAGRRDPGRLPARRPGPADRYRAGRLRRRGRDAASPRSTASRSARAASSRSRAPPAAPTVVVRLDPETRAPSGVLRRSSSLAVDAGEHLASPSRSSSRPTGGRTAHALLLPADATPTSRGRPASGRRSSCISHGGPTGATRHRRSNLASSSGPAAASRWST